MANSSPVTVISLDEKRLHNVNDIIFSDETHQILSLIEKKAHTEVQIEEKLSLDGATVHQILGGLLTAGVIEAKKLKRAGGVIQAYQLKRSPVVVLPTVRRTLFSRFKQLIPVITVVVVVSGILQLVYQQGTKAVLDVVGIEAEDSAVTVAANTPTGELSFQIAPWFLIGAIFAILVFVAYDFWKEKNLGAK